MGGELERSESGRHIVAKRWGTVVRSNDTGRPLAVYRAGSPWVSRYRAKAEQTPLLPWEDVAVLVGMPVLSAGLISSFGLNGWTMIVANLLAIGAVIGAHLFTRRVTTARRLFPGKAITSLILTQNDELIAAAIDTVIGFDTDPEGAADLVAELDAAWLAARACSAPEKDAILNAFREVASSFPTTGADVRQVRREIASARVSLAALTAARGELDAAISTAELADAPRSLDALRAATQALDEEIEVVRGVTQEQLRATFRAEADNQA